ncbi:hypothetical protein [Thermincola ferriacetica]
MVTRKSLLQSIVIVTVSSLMLWGIVGFIYKPNAKEIAAIQGVINKAIYFQLDNQATTKDLSEIYIDPLVEQGINQVKELNEIRSISKIENVVININGELATAEADIIWTKTSDLNSTGSNHVKFTLSKIIDKWKITGEEISPITWK